MPVRAVAVIWDMHVFINQLIECEIPFKRYFYMDWNFESKIGDIF